MVINEKLKAWAEERKVWGEEQSGFGKGRGGLEIVFVLKDLIDKNKKQGEEVYLIFIDIEKAYYTVDRNRLTKLHSYWNRQESSRGHKTVL